MSTIEAIKPGSNSCSKSTDGGTFVTKVWRAILSAITKAYLKRKRRKILQDLDDHLLRDIGVSRHDIDAPDRQQKDLFKHIGW